MLGEILGLLGLLGCGKIILLRIIVGFEIFISGIVYLEGDCVFGENGFIFLE